MSLCVTHEDEQKFVKARIIAWIAAVTAAAALFVLLFPYVTGMAAPKDWLEIGRGILRIWY